MSGRHRKLRGFARDIAYKFAVSAAHYAYLAAENREPQVTIDLLGESIAPAVFDIERNRCLANQCRENLRYIVTRVNPVVLKSAILTARFNIGVIKPGTMLAEATEVSYSVILTDGKGREWVGIYRDDF